MNEDELREERAAIIMAMQSDLATASRSMYEMIPVLANRYMNSPDLNEAIFGLDDTYYSQEVKLYFAFFCGRSVERAEWIRQIDAFYAQAMAMTRDITKQILKLEKRIGHVEKQHEEIMEKSDQLLAEARQVTGTQSRK